MFDSLRKRLSFLFIAFVTLVLVSVGVTYWGLETQREDALVINLAGRQRMLTQQMARLAYQVGKDATFANASMQDTQSTFDQTLRALMDGGEAPYFADKFVTLRATINPEILKALAQVQSTWLDFSASLDHLQLLPRDEPAFFSTLQAVEENSSNLVQQADFVVRLYEADSTARVNQLRTIQIIFLAIALSLLGLGAWITRVSVLHPLTELSRAADRVGANDLETSVQVQGPVEIQALARSFDSMRMSLLANRRDLSELNSSLEERVTQRTRELETLNDVSRDISSRLDIQQVLDSVTEKARLLVGGEIASLCLVDENRHWLRLQAISGPQEAINSQVVSIDEGLAEKVLGSEQALLCGTGACLNGCRMVAEAFRTSHVAAPLRAGEQVIGALCVGSQIQNQFSPEATGMLTKLSTVAAVALENARLYSQAERVATLEERRRVAAEMHDGLGQTLSYLGLMTDQVVSFLSAGRDAAALDKLKKTRATIQTATAEVRRAIDNLMDESPAPLDLSVRLRNCIKELTLEDDLKIVDQVADGFSPKCSKNSSDQVLNFTREALKNAARHAQANQIVVRADAAVGHYFVSVSDNGKGFDTSQPEPKGHFGLQIMRARATAIGGQLEIESKPGAGTRVTLIWPLRVES